MSNVDDFLRLREDARALFPTLKPFALVEQTGPNPEWLHFNNAGIPQYNIPSGYDVNANQELYLVAYHEPGHELEEYLRIKDPTMAHRQKFMTFIDHPLSWDLQKAIADAQQTPNQQHAMDPGEWWADAFANGVAGEIVVDKDHTQDALANRAFFQALIDIVPIPRPTIEWLGPAASGNFMVGRQGNPIVLIVDHWIAGSFASAVRRFKTPGAQVSATFIVGMEGRIGQMVLEQDTAYHAGNFDVNLISIGIEHECGPTLAPTDLLYAASAQLHRYLADKYEIDLQVGVTVKRHNNIVPTQCPGTLDLDRIVAEAGGEFVTDEEFLEKYHRLISKNDDLDGTIESMKKVEEKTVLANRAAGEILAKTNLP